MNDSKRILDVVAAFLLLFFAAAPMLVIGIMVKVTSRGPAIHWSRRVGRDNAIFRMPKFRTLRLGAPDVATHLMTDIDAHLTPVGNFLRKSSLDELPQLWSVLIGDMSLVGPRPALHNQEDLIALRAGKKVSSLRPGITGWAQIHGRDAVSIPEKVALDEDYLRHQSIMRDMVILFKTVTKVIRKEGVAH